MAMKMKYRSKSSMLDAIKQLTANIPEEGKEFPCWEEVEKIVGIEFYFEILTAHGREVAMKTATVF